MLVSLIIIIDYLNLQVIFPSTKENQTRSSRRTRLQIRVKLKENAKKEFELNSKKKFFISISNTLLDRTKCKDSSVSSC